MANYVADFHLQVAPEHKAERDKPLNLQNEEQATAGIDNADKRLSGN